jgi:hypothetical protein
MSSASPIPERGRKIADGTATIDEMAGFVSLHIPDAVGKVNTLFSPRQLMRASDDGV